MVKLIFYVLIDWWVKNGHIYILNGVTYKFYKNVDWIKMVIRILKMVKRYYYFMFILIGCKKLS